MGQEILLALLAIAFIAGFVLYPAAMWRLTSEIFKLAGNLLVTAIGLILIWL